MTEVPRIMQLLTNQQEIDWFIEPHAFSGETFKRLYVTENI